MKYKCLTIAGFDGSGGAGMQADLKTFSAFDCYGMTVLTAIAVQNTCGVKECFDLPLKCVEEQLYSIFEDIKPDSVKIGMLFNKKIVNLIAKFIEKNVKGIPIVLDPVMYAKNGCTLLKHEAIDCLKSELLPLCSLVTPNMPEAYHLAGRGGGLEEVAQEILDLGVESVLIKGGHREGEIVDDFLISANGNKECFSAERIDSSNTHGTGCTLSAVICALLARGVYLPDACRIAKNYLWHAIEASREQSVGQGKGPVDHFYHLRESIDKFINEKQ